MVPVSTVQPSASQVIPLTRHTASSVCCHQGGDCGVSRPGPADLRTASFIRLSGTHYTTSNTFRVNTFLRRSSWSLWQICYTECTATNCEKFKGSVQPTDISEQQADQLGKTTCTQHKSSFWFAVRAGRITASNMHAVNAADVRSPAQSTIKKKGQHNNHDVSTFGFFINPLFPEIGASPDGIVRCNCCGKGCVEIKFPSKYKNNTIREACLAKDFCLELVDGKVQLKQSYQYYTQSQTNIFVTDRYYWDFVVWTLKDSVVLQLDANPEFWREQELRLKMLPCWQTHKSLPSEEEHSVNQKKEPGVAQNGGRHLTK
uniref:YqaJ viral recombinase domain-containing protein n=1 Tax=Cyprinus carpio TaxID=7962 RepID=A0A8C2EE23_CYPCA